MSVSIKQTNKPSTIEAKYCLDSILYRSHEYKDELFLYTGHQFGDSYIFMSIEINGESCCSVTFTGDALLYRAEGFEVTFKS